MNEVERMINEIKEQSKGEKWIFIKTKATIVDFDNKMKDFYFDSAVERFFVNNNHENVIDEIIQWTTTQVDVDENPIYTQDYEIEKTFEKTIEVSPKYWLIFFRQR